MTTVARSDVDAADPGDGAAEPTDAARRPILDVLCDALVDIEDVRLVLDIPGAGAARGLRERLLVQIRNHLVPRLGEVEFPAVVVLGGPSGAGKSTLLNSLLGEEVSQADVLRPTTRRPVLAVHPDDAATMAQHPVAAVVEVVQHTGVPRGLVLVDTPDLDSVEHENRHLAAQLVEVADLWVFVTSATRYGDAVPWTTLTAARDRGVTVAVVLNRVSPGARGEIRGDLLDRLAAEDLGDAPMFVLPDLAPHEGRLPATTVAEVARWLTLLAESAAGQRVASRTIRGGWRSLRDDVDTLADAVQAQADAAAHLLASTSATIEPHVTATQDAIRGGEAGAGTPRSLWQAATREGGPLAPLVDGAGRVSGRAKAIRTRGEAAAAIGEATLAAVRGLLSDAAAAAERSVRGAWVAGDHGAAALLAGVDRDTTAAARQARTAAAAQAFTDAVARGLDAAPLLRAERAARLLDVAGWAHLVCAAAAGLDGAAHAVDVTLGVTGTAVRTSARDVLVRHAGAVVEAERQAFATALLGVDAAPSAEGMHAHARELEEGR